MAREAVLLIGTGKTGTTTPQQFLARNRATLRSRGVLCPSSCGDINHTGLADYAMDSARLDDLRAPYGYGGPADLGALRARIEAAAREELSGWDGRALFCNEHCHSRLTNPAEVAALKGLRDPFFDRIHVAVYLRRADLAEVRRLQAEVAFRDGHLA